MTDYFHEMGWQELPEGEQPDHLLMARFLLDMGILDDIVGEWPRLPPPASKEAVEKLPDVVVGNACKDCPICLKEFKKIGKAKKMPCNHIFHATCLLTWLKQTNSCPVCRHELPTDDKGYEAFKKEQIRCKQRQADVESLHNAMFS